MSKKSTKSDSGTENAQDNKSPEGQEDGSSSTSKLNEMLGAKGGAIEHPDYEELEAKLSEAEQNSDKYKDQYLRAMADIENLRRTSKIDLENAYRSATKHLIQDLIPVIDSLEQALQHADEGKDSMREGIELTLNMFIEVLKKHEIEQINPVGEAFNPDIHEAMTMQPSEEHESNTVLTVLQKGYKHRDRIIRAARVIVCK